MFQPRRRDARRSQRACKRRGVRCEAGSGHAMSFAAGRKRRNQAGRRLWQQRTYKTMIRDADKARRRGQRDKGKLPLVGQTRKGLFVSARRRRCGSNLGLGPGPERLWGSQSRTKVERDPSDPLGLALRLIAAEGEGPTDASSPAGGGGGRGHRMGGLRPGRGADRGGLACHATNAFCRPSSHTTSVATLGQGAAVEGTPVGRHGAHVTMASRDALVCAGAMLPLSNDAGPPVACRPALPTYRAGPSSLPATWCRTVQHNSRCGLEDR